MILRKMNIFKGFKFNSYMKYVGCGDLKNGHHL